MPSSTSNSAVDPLIGTTIGGTYKVIRKIGTGGMGSVYEAHHARLPRKFAIKVMLPEIASDQVSFERFRREAETTSSLGNVHIAEVMDFNALEDGSPYMVMEFLEGEDLGSRLDRDGPLSTRRTALVVAQMADALASAHGRGVVHRDIKPGNIFLVRRERDDELVKLLDFGAAKSKRRKQSNLTMAGVVVGTPWYMSPEQAQGKELDARSDQFSLAVLTYEMLTARLPFEHEDSTQVLFKIVEEPPVPIRERDSRLPEKLDAVLGRALSKDPAERFKSVIEFSDRLCAALGAPVPKRPAHDGPEVTNPGATVIVAIKPEPGSGSAATTLRPEPASSAATTLRPEPASSAPFARLEPASSAATTHRESSGDQLDLDPTKALERPRALDRPDFQRQETDPDDDVERTRQIVARQRPVRRSAVDPRLLRGVVIAALGGAVVGAAVGAWFYFGRHSSEPPRQVVAEPAEPAPPPAPEPPIERPVAPAPVVATPPETALAPAPAPSPEVRLRSTSGSRGAHAGDPRHDKPGSPPAHR